MIHCCAVAVAILSILFLTPAQAEAPDSEGFVAAFGEVCVPDRLSYKGTLALAERLGWRPVVIGENADYDRFIAHATDLLAREVAEDPDLYRGDRVARGSPARSAAAPIFWLSVTC